MDLPANKGFPEKKKRPILGLQFHALWHLVPSDQWLSNWWTAELRQWWLFLDPLQKQTVPGYNWFPVNIVKRIKAPFAIYLPFTNLVYPVWSLIPQFSLVKPYSHSGLAPHPLGRWKSFRSEQPPPLRGPQLLGGDHPPISSRKLKKMWFTTRSSLVIYPFYPHLGCLNPHMYWLNHHFGLLNPCFWWLNLQ